MFSHVVRRTQVFIAALLALFALRVAGAQGSARTQATVLFLSDFGTKDGAVAVCKGVMWNIEPTLRIVDLTHEIPAYDIETAAEVLEQAIPFYPPGTVTVAVVDPGVGSERKAVALLTKKGHLLVGPDNGIFTLVLETEGLDRAVELRDRRYFRQTTQSFTFHGRDIFSPVAAHLAAGIPIDSLGPPVIPMRLDLHAAQRRDSTIVGIVRYVEDPYGNVVTNIGAALLDSIAHVGDSLDVQIGRRRFLLPWRSTFSNVPRGKPLAVIHSRGLLSFSINQGNFAATYRVTRKDSVAVRRRVPGAVRARARSG
jgi:S-adenosylmethionine hydrolase